VGPGSQPGGGVNLCWHRARRAAGAGISRVQLPWTENRVVPQLLKPDVIGPGVNILAGGRRRSARPG
jgi:hypothetical protein